jgi:hypothetical protein
MSPAERKARFLEIVARGVARAEAELARLRSGRGPSLAERRRDGHALVTRARRRR